METNINSYLHSIVLQHIKPTDLCLDATCGNGYDTVFLAQHAAFVHAIDIQEMAIQNTLQQLQSNHIKNVSLYHNSHDQLHTLFPNMQFNIIMYNLGYLPNSDHTIKTTPSTTLSSLQQAINLLAPKGIITITLYTKHEGGFEESQAIETYLRELDKKEYTIIKSTYLNRAHSPYVIIIQKG